MLIEIEPGTVIQADQIETAETFRIAGRSQPKMRVTFASGRAQVFDVPPDRLDRYLGHIVSAPAGYGVIVSNEPDDREPEPFHYVLPVVAFRVDGTSGGPLQPITDEGEPYEHWTWGLIRPDGTVTSWDRSFDTVDDYKAHFASTTRRAAA